MTAKYRSWVFALAVLMAACAQTATPSSSPTPIRTSVFASPTPGLPAAIAGHLVLDRHWHTVPDGFDRSPLRVTVMFDGDVTAGAPYVALSGRGAGTTSPNTMLTRTTGNTWSAEVPLDGLTPGFQPVQIMERLDANTAQAVASDGFLLTQPEYVVWTLDFEGDASGDSELANTAAIADGLAIPMAVFWNPRAWTSDQVSAERQVAMLAWTKARQAKGDEVALHLHMWTDYVRAAGLTARATPSWAGRGDGYDVPITAYPEAEQKALIDYGLKLMADHGLPKPTSFRAGGDMADAATLRAAVAAGFDLDCTAVATDYPPIGRIPYPWTLPAGAQPYRPSSTDANAVGDLPLLEAPTIGGNTYAFTVNTIQPQIRANLALLAPAGTVAMTRKAITVVSHPGTIVPAERAAIEALLGAFDGLRYDKDQGPVRFVTAAQLARAYR